MASPLARPAPDWRLPAAGPAVRVRNFTRRFGDVTVLHDLEIEIGRGEFVALLGRSGSGKTTLLRTLAGIDPAPGHQVLTPAARAVVFQDARLLPWKKVWRNVALGLKGADTRARAEAALTEVGLDHRLDAWPATLSGGEAQRVSLARALVRDPGLLLLDEPFAAVDAFTRLKLQQEFKALLKLNRPTVLFVTHDVPEAIALGDVIVVMTQRPASVQRIIPVAREDRDRASPAYARKLAETLACLGVTSDMDE